jgi:hypothetical protein|tara:strand:+ start:248 stop:1141 length:894 start_codon:yes stop_codon:yes gene_type:complete
MTDSFGALKRNKAENFDKLTASLNKLNSKSSGPGPDERFWKPEVDKAGNGYAVIRFLPESEGEDVPFVRKWDHGFQGPGGWYIEDSLTTLGQKDPVSEYNSMLWNSGIESNKDKARKQKRRLSFISNIYVVKDPSNPDNEGKVFLYKYGKKIFDKLNEAMNPQFEDESPVNPFDLWEGADFKLKIRNVEGFRNYDKSELDVSAPLFDDDEELEKVWKSQHALQEFVNPTNFKTYEELQTKLNRVLGLDGAAPSTTAESNFQAEPPAEIPEAPAAVQPEVAASEDDESLDFFKKLAED